MKNISTRYSCGISTILLVILMSLAGTSALFAQNRIIVNRSFETGSGIPHGDVAYLASQANPNPQIDGWYSTHPPYNGVNFPIEHWHTGFQGVSSQQGDYHVELNVTQSSRLYQIVYLVHGEIFHWEYFHRQRVPGATETVQYSIYSQDGSTNLFVIDTHTSTNNTGWDERSGNYSFNGTSGIYQIGFESTTGGGSGNFLDNISIGLDALSEFTRSLATVVETNSTYIPYIKLNGEVNAASSITFQVTSTNAVEGVDYTFPTKTKQIAAGQYSLADSTPLDFHILNNPASKGTRTLKLTVTSVTGDVLFKDSDGSGFDSTLTITILENYNPGGVAGSNIWYLPANVVTSGGAVDSWNNTGLLQANATGSGTARPAYNSTGTGQVNFNPSLGFDGSNDQLSTSNLASIIGLNGSNDVGTQFAVYRKTNSSGAGAVYQFALSGAGQAWRVGLNTDGYMVQQNISRRLPVVASEVALIDMTASTSSGSGNLDYQKNGSSAGVVSGGAYTNVGNNYPLKLGEYAGGYAPMSLTELIIYPSVLSAANRNKVQSYLALKYGISLGNNSEAVAYTSSAVTSIWVANATFKYDIFGIGKDDASGLNQSSSNSINSGGGDGTGQSGKGNIVLSAPSSLDNNDFLMIGHDNGSLAEQSTDLPPSLTGGKRVGREWKVKHTGDVGTVQLTFNLSGLTVGGTSVDHFKLLKSPDGNFGSGATIIRPTTYANSILTFAGLSLADGEVITFVTNTAGPGVPGANLWLKADAGATNSGSNLTGWADQTGLNTFTVTGTPGYLANAINFKPGVTFNNTNGNTTLPTHRLDGNTPVTYVDGFAVYKSNANQSTLIGSTIGGANYGPALFSADGAGSVYVGNGTAHAYQHFINPNLSQFGIANLDVSLTVTPYATGRLNGGNQTMTNGTGGNFDNITLTPVIGGTNNNGDPNGWYPFNGQVAEMVLYPSSLATADKLKVESYLAVKYGITLNSSVSNYVSSSGAVIWNNNSFWNDVFGVGKDDASGLNQSSSNSINSGGGDGTGQSGKGNIVISNPSSLDNNDFLMIGHDNGSLGDQATGIPPSLAGQCKKRFGRTWKVKRTGDVGTVSVKVDFTGLTFSGPLGNTSGDFKLLLNTDGTGNFSTGTVVPVNAASFAGNIATFSGVNIPDNTVFTVLFPVDNSSSSSTTMAACGSYVWNGTIYTNSGTYTYHTTNAAGCDSTATLHLTINHLPVPTISGAVNACSGSSSNSYSTEGGMTGYTWLVSPGGTITAGSGTSNIAISWNTTGSQSVSVNYTNSNNCTAASPTVLPVTVITTGQVNQPSNQIVCNGSTTAVITFTTTNTGGTTTYSWTNNQPGIGLAASGTGNIASFAATNSGTGPVVATIVVTPTFSNGLVSCIGTTKSFLITVNPAGQVNQPASQELCNGSTAPAITFATANTGGTTTYAWTNNQTSIGIPASGTGNIASFTTINNGTSPVIATIVVTPNFSNGSVNCSGPAKTFAITVNPTGQVNQPSSQVLCNGSATAPVTFGTTNTGGTTTYSWTNNKTSIGLAASGTGNIASFTAINTGTSPVIATIVVTPAYTNGQTTCTGPAKTFTITVNPTGRVNQPSSQVLCNGSATSPITFGTTNTGGTTTYAWTNDQSGIGLAASGTGNIASFTAINSGTAPVIATIVVTPTFTNGSVSCGGSTKTFTITVNPTGQVNQPSNQVLCNGSATSAIIFTTANSGGTTSFTWTNDQPGIGLASSGTGDIASFTAINSGSAPVVATIEVTPVFTNGSSTCTGPLKIFTITVNPTAQADEPQSQLVCNGSPTSTINFTTVNTGGTTTYSWTNDTPGIGLAASGTGNIPSFTAINTALSPVMALIVVTPTFTNGLGSCTGPQQLLLIIVNPTGQVNQPSSQVLCNGSSTSVITFTTGNTGGTTTYSWTNNQPGIGLASGGTGDIASFTAINNGTTPVIATIVVTPTFTIGPVSCPGPSKSFTITVNPTGQVNQPSSQVLCNGSATTAITFGTTNTGGTTTYAWTNNQPGIGLAASGTGNIASFTAANNGTSPVIATIVVTPTFTNGTGSCAGPSRTFNITVNPTGQVNQPSSQELCNGSTASAIIFATANSGGTTTYAWTNNQTSIGLAASGTGNIASFTATNSGTSPVIATITVTPTFGNGSVNCNGSTKTFTITVNPTAQVNQPSSQVLCNGSAATAINFGTTNTGGTTTYSWTNTKTSIGLAASSTGNIASFAATNTGTSPVIATIVVTPSFANGAITCSGPSKTFTITINPTGRMNQPANQVLCNGSATSAITFGTTNTGGTTTYAWTNNQPGIGLAASGTGNIASFAAINNGTTPIIATIVVTPTFTNGSVSCSGSTRTFTITVNPTGQVNQPSGQVLCNGSLTSAITFGTTNTGGSTTFAWTNDQPGIGLASSGTGDIASFAVNNNDPVPVVATIVVTPTFTNGSVSCTGPSKTFSITVNPIGQMNPLLSQSLCNGAAVAPVTFTTNNTGGVTTFVWTNNQPGIGLAASGTGSIASFTSLNTGTAPVVATIVVTPTFTFGSGSCPGPSETFNITVNPTGQVNQPSSQVLCNGSSTSAVTFGTVNAGGTTTYSWTNDQPGIGLASGGTGNIASFTAINNGTAPVIATIVVTPTFANGTVSCPGPSKSYTLTVNPTAQVNQPSSQVLCNGSATTSITFGTTNTGGTTTYSWTNNQPGIGLAASGTGNIASFAAINNGTTPVIATIAVTPTLSNGSVNCSGSTKTFTITVNPTAQANQPSSQVLCNGSATAAVTFTTTNTGGSTTYSWTNSKTSIGLAASGTGNIASFTAINTGTSPVIATIVVTPVFTNGTITCSGPSKTFPITVNPAAKVNQPSNQALCNGAATAPVTFTTTNTGGTTTYTWTNSQPGIGLAASGTGNIGSFTAINNGIVPVIATIVVTPTFSYGSVSCGGSPKSFEITVNPAAQVSQPSNQVLCNGSATTAITFTTTNTGGTTTYSWTNDQPGIGLASVGTGNIASFITTNNDSVPVVATIVVTPTFTNGSGSCSGPVKSFTITVNPTGDVNHIPNQELCHGSATSAINFTTGNTGGTTTFAWTNSQTSIGLAASGTGNIASFTALNTGTAPVVATIVVTPTFINGSGSCPGPSQTFNITVNPTGQVNQPSSQVLCNGSASSAVSFTTIITGGNTTFTWTNNQPGIGLAASGTGNIPSFTAINIKTKPVIATIAVTPLFTNGSVGCTGATKTFTITVNPSGQVNQPSSQSLCNGSVTSAVSFTTGNTGGTSTYTWTNDQPGIGLASGGTGNIAAFTAINNGTAPVMATIVVTPIFTNGSVSCNGSTKSFTITVNPTGQVNQPSDQQLCDGSSSSVTFSSVNTGGTTTYSWTNDQPAIGLAGSGTGNIPSFTAVNNGSVPIIATIVVTPTFNNGSVSCAGPSKTFNITVNPLPVPTISGPVMVCLGGQNATYSTESSMTGYIWTVSSGGTIVSGGTPTSNFVSVSWNTSGAQTVAVNYSGTYGCPAATPAVYNVSINPAAQPYIFGGSSACVQSAGNVYFTQAGMTNYEWVVTAGGTLTAGAGTDTIHVTWNRYVFGQAVQVNFTNEWGCRSMYPSTHYVTVHPLPVPTLTGPSAVTAGTTGVVYTTEAGQSNYVWVISPGGIITSGGTSLHNTAVVTWSTPGEQWISVNYSDPVTGCTAAVPLQFTVTVSTTPFITVTSPNGGESWQPGSVHTITWNDNIPENVKIDLYKAGAFLQTLVASVPSTGSYSWTISPDQGSGSDYRVKITSTADPLVTGMSAADFTIASSVPVTLVVQNVTVTSGQVKCYDATQTITVAGGGTTFLVQGSGSATFIAGQNILYLPGTTVEPGGYMHGYIAPNGPWCGTLAPSIPAVVAGETVLPFITEQSYFKVYPNPTDGKFTVEYIGDGKLDKMNIEVFGMKGDKLMAKEVTGERKHTFTLEGRPTGIYLVRVVSEGNVTTVRLIKQ